MKLPLMDWCCVFVWCSVCELNQLESAEHVSECVPVDIMQAFPNTFHTSCTRKKCVWKSVMEILLSHFSIFRYVLFDVYGMFANGIPERLSDSDEIDEKRGNWKKRRAIVIRIDKKYYSQREFRWCIPSNFHFDVVSTPLILFPSTTKFLG